MKFSLPAMTLTFFTWQASSCAWAEGTRVPNFYADAQLGLITYKSKLAASNDTGTALRYGVGSCAGSEGQLRFNLMIDTASTNFALNDSKLTLAWQDTAIRYQWAWFYVGALFSRLEMTAHIEGADKIDAAGSGFGGTTGFLFDVGKRAQLNLDISSASIAKMTNALEGEVKLGSRLDVDLGSQVELGKKFLFAFGYRMRTMSISFASTSYAELVTSTYAGLRYSLYF